ncbi:MAG: peptidase S41 [Lentimicrobiaceae bacterium]|jgi:Tol biopolymer transport system component/C-terminal processing protease CtpA/Prc|nr:peptidase S41 [Lentimicrobiaceae bacterium]
MKHVTRIAISILFCCFSTVFAQEEALWTRYPVLSPDGSTIVFCYKGDLFKVSSEGGFAVQLTTNTAYDFHPIWSNDGQTIAFASNRNGNFDIYAMPIEGGTPKRLTYWSGSEIPLSFSTDDQTIYFRSKIMTKPDFSLMSISGIGETYTVDISGTGRPTLFTPVYMESIDFNKNGTALLYYDMKGYEDKWRKHHVSSVTRDVWMYDLNTKSHTQLSDFAGENRSPVFDPNDDNTFYYLNEKNGSFNIYKRKLNSKNEQQLTYHKDHPVRFLSIADNGLLCYFFDGSIYTLKEGETPKKLQINIRTDKTEADYKVEFRKGGISEMSVSPNGKEIAFIIRGDVYVTSADFATTMRVTNTAEQERNVSFSPDGRSLVYASERNGCWQVYVSELVRDEDKYFTYAKEIKEKQITKSDVASFQPAFSPDGKEIAFLENRTTLKVINLKSEKTRTILGSEYNYSYSDGDQWYEWSPDGKWFAVNFFEKGGWQNEDVGIVKADGSGEIHNLTQSGYVDSGGGWQLDGKALLWYSDRNGMRSHGSWGSQRDIFLQFFDQEAFDKFTATKEEAALVKEREDEAKKEKKKKDKEKDSTEIVLPEITYDIINAENRIVRLTVTSASHGSCFLSKNADTLYYFAAFEKGFDLWVRDFKENTIKLLAKLGTGYAQLDSDKNKKNLFMLSNGTISKINTDKGTTKAVEINAEYTYKPEQERDYIFYHAWQQVVDKFYDPEIHGLDWNMYREVYAKFLPHINNNADFAEMLSELLGELNASHTGAGYRASRTGDQTAVLGMFFDENYTGDGLKIAEILEKNPMIKADSKIKEGVIILKIDGNKIKSGEDYFRYLNHKTQKNTLLTLSDGKKQWDEVVKPLSGTTQNELLYQRWVKQREKLVEKLSDGKIGYVHVRGMDGQSFRKIFSDVLGKNRNKEAIVIDTRFNGGGWLHDDLATFFNGKHYADFVPRGQYIASEPWNKWYKKSAVVMNEGNYSDAHGFPFTYKALQIGKLIGMPVPGTMTAVWWETQIDNTLFFGIPQVGIKDLEGDYLENKQLMPDILINNDPNSMTEGHDLQIEAAVKHLLEEITK